LSRFGALDAVHERRLRHVCADRKGDVPRWQVKINALLGRKETVIARIDSTAVGGAGEAGIGAAGFRRHFVVADRVNLGVKGTVVNG